MSMMIMASHPTPGELAKLAAQKAVGTMVGTNDRNIHLTHLLR